MDRQMIDFVVRKLESWQTDEILESDASSVWFNKDSKGWIAHTKFEEPLESATSFVVPMSDVMSSFNRVGII